MSSSVRDKDTRTAGPNWFEIFKIFLVRSGTNRFWSVNPWLESYFSVLQKTFSGFLKSLKFFIGRSFWYSSCFTLHDFISVLIWQPMRKQRFEIFPDSTYRRPLIICNSFDWKNELDSSCQRKTHCWWLVWIIITVWFTSPATSSDFLLVDY